ncbi:MAG: hypothetical protein ACK4K1_02530 [Flavobacterium sp.]
MYKNPSKQKVQDNATLIGGAVLGGMLSRVVVDKIHTPTGAKNENLMLIGKRLLIVAASGYLASGIDAKDTASNVVKGSLLGMAVTQAVEATSDALKTSSATANKVASNPFLAAATGLKCPKGVAYAAPLNVPGYIVAKDPVIKASTNIFEAAIEEASYAVN